MAKNDNLPSGLSALGRNVRYAVAEREEISAFLGDLPAAPIHQGAARLFEAVAADHAAPKPGSMVARLAAFYSGAEK